MDPKNDAYGQEMWAYFNGEKNLEIVERDDGFCNAGDGVKDSYFSNYKYWSVHERQALKFVKGKVLDVGCGAGRVALYLQKKGFDVLGIDNSPLAIKVCKKRGFKKARLMAIEEVGKFRAKTFDTIIMFGNNFGLFGSPKKAKLLLKKFYKITSDNALIIAESNNLYKTSDPAHLKYHKFNRKRGRMPGQLRIRIRFRGYVGKWFDYLLVSPQEMRGILQGTGWKIKKIFNSNKSAYIAVIEKKNKK